MKRKLMIARSLLHQPKILILDEPTAGVDVETRQHMWDFLKKLNKQSKTTFLLTTHYIEEAEQLCDKIAIIQKGRIIACDTKNKIMKNFGKKELVFTLKEQITEKNETGIKKLLVDYKIKIDKNNNQIKINISSEKIDYNKFLKIIQQFNIKKISTEEKNLEQIFVELTTVYS
jgi:ABC-2 type transport system ATP-binding protein